MLTKRLEISRLKVTEDPEGLHLRAIEVDLRRRKRMVRKNVIVVTAGLGLDANDEFKLSYAFEAILRWVRAHLREQDMIFLPPAPSYGATRNDGARKCEGEFADEWLQREGIPASQVKSLGIKGEHYLDGDTRRGNAYGTKKALKEGLLAPDAENILVVYYLQALRALTVFTQEGVQVSRVVAIQPINTPDEDQKMVPQLKYYNQRWLHVLYEMAATMMFATELDKLVYEFAPAIRSNDAQ